MESNLKHSYLLYWICDNQRIHKNLYCKIYNVMLVPTNESKEKIKKCMD